MRPDAGQGKSNLSFLKGSAALERGEYKLAEVGFAQALHEDPSNAQAMIFLLYAQLKRRPTLRPVVGLQEALEMAPNDTVVLRAASRVLVILDQAPKAIALLEKARSVQPGDAETQAELASAYLGVRKRAECEAAFKEALRIAPDNALALSVKRSFAQMYFDAAPAQQLEAQPLRKEAGTVDSYLADAKVSLNRNEWAKGYWNLREALRLEPKSLEAREALGALLRKRFPLYDRFYRFSQRAVQWRLVSSFVLVYAVARLIMLIGASNLPYWAAPLLLGAVVFILGFAVAVIWPMPIVNFGLRFHPIGRQTLTRLDRAENGIVAGALLSTFLCLASVAVLRTGLMIELAAIDLVLFSVGLASACAARSTLARSVVAVTLAVLLAGSLVLSGLVAFFSIFGAGM